MSLEPKSPGSFKDYAAERTHPAVATDELTLRRSYDDELTRYRHDLATERGVTIDELHRGVGTAALEQIVVQHETPENT